MQPTATLPTHPATKTEHPSALFFQTGDRAHEANPCTIQQTRYVVAVLHSSPPNAVLFDVDGVLLDTERLYTQATEEIVNRYGKHFCFELKAQLMGRSATESAALLLTTLEIPLSVEDYLAERTQILEPLFARAAAMPGAESIVGWLDSCGVPLAIATSSGRRLFELKSHQHPWFARFNAVVCGDDPRLSNPKPAPDIFLLAARQLGIPPGECVVVEDSPAGVEAASKAGMRVIVLADPRLDRSLLPEQATIIHEHGPAAFEALGIRAS